MVKKYLLIFLMIGSYDFPVFAMVQGYEAYNPDVLNRNINNAKTYEEYIAAVKALNKVSRVSGWEEMIPMTENAWMAQKHIS